MSEIALYYPYVHPREESWVKQALLFWPRIQRIVPADYPVTDTPTLRLLVDEGILTERLPDPGAAELSESFVEFLTRHATSLQGAYSVEKATVLPPRPGWNDAELDPRLGWIHTGKLDENAQRALFRSRLAVPHIVGASWLGMHPALADVYMCSLAGQLARLAKGTTSPVTDGPLHHVGAFGWSIAEIARALLTDLTWAADAAAPDDDPDGEATLVAVAMRALVPSGLDKVPMERILKLRDDHKSEFARYRHGIGTLVDEVASLDKVRDPETLAQHIEVRYEQTVSSELNDLRASLKSNGVRTTFTALSLQIVAPSTLVGGAATHLTSAAIGAAAGTAIAVGKAAHDAATQRRSAMAESSAAWLVRIEEDLSPQTLLGRVRASLRRFGA